MKSKFGNIRLIGLVVAVAFFLFILVPSGTERGIQFSALSYSSAFEGPKADFLGVTYNNMEYTSANSHGASVCSGMGVNGAGDTSMSFNVDGSNSGLPQIEGQMTPIFLPQDSLTTAPSWVPRSWLVNSGAVVQDPNLGIIGAGGANPPWNWTIGNDTYSMKEFDMRYYVSFKALWSGSEDPKGDVPDPWLGGGGLAYNVYHNLGVWIHIDISPTWYIAGGGTAYFAVGVMTLAEDVQMQEVDNNKQTFSARTDMSVNPEAQLKVQTLWYGPFGTAATQPGSDSADNPEQQYEGRALNPAFFTNSLYMHVDLTNFGVYSGEQGGTSTYTRGDTVSFAFDLKVFVFGDYKVQDIQKDPGHFGFTASTAENGVTFLTGLFDWLVNPVNISLLVAIGIFVLILIFAPWLLLVIVSLFAGGRKR